MQGRFIEWLNRPEYIYQPSKLISRIFGKKAPIEGEEIVELPWELPIEVDCRERIGRIIAHHGVFELPVVEAIFRLTDRGDIALDVGANIGYMAAAAASAGAKRVICFEPHPVLFDRLERNLQRWNQVPGFSGQLEARQEAVSSARGSAALRVPREGFAENQGLATLESRDGQPGYDEVSVTTTTIDTVTCEIPERIGILKIDIEEHEYHAFLGAIEMLRHNRVRDIIYEDYGGVGSESSKLLASFGYSVFGLQRSVFGPLLLDGTHTRPWWDHNLLATLEPERARKRMAARGFVSLSRSRKKRFAASAGEASES